MVLTKFLAIGAAALMATGTAALAVEPAAEAAKPPVDPMQKIVCRRDKTIGSLIRSQKTCHTKAQWAYIDDTNQGFSRDLVDTTRTRSGGN